MQHRHLNHQRFTLAAIDDIISRGRWNDWVGVLIVFSRAMEYARYSNDASMYAVGALVGGLLLAGCLVGFGNIAKMAAKAEWNTRKK